MARTLPPLSSLRAFEAAARHLSFVRAGAELRVTPGAVSHQVKLLEKSVGRLLFERRSNGVTLTEAGRQLAARVGTAFDQLAAATASTRDPVAQASVSIRCQFSVAARWLVPRLHAFQSLHPHIRVTLSAVPQSWMAHEANPDVSIYYRRGAETGTRQDPLVQGRMVVVAAPWLVERLPQPARPADLLSQPLLDTRPTVERTPELGWADWFMAVGVGRLDLRPALSFNLDLLTIEACLAGAGFAIIPDVLVEREIADGRLVQMFDTTFPIANTYYLITPEANLAREEVATLRQWLIEHRSLKHAAAPEPLAADGHDLE